MAVSAARKIAFETLRRVESEGAYASDLLHSGLAPHRKTPVEPKDAALATELTLGVLRWQRLLDFLIERQIQKPVGKLDLPVLLALRLGVYQLRCLEKVPQRAAVHESVELVKMAKKTSAAGFVNAVLRRLAREAKTAVESLLPPNISAAERLGITHSHPTWLAERWLARWGEAATQKVLEANNRIPRLACIVHDWHERDAILTELERQGLRVAPGAFLKNAFVTSGGSISLTNAFQRGAISIQDEASQAIPLLLGVRPQDHVLDLCAAPGGKTAGVARAAETAAESGSENSGGGLVVAADFHAHRVAAMRAQFQRLGLAHIQIIALDATQVLPFAQTFDKILVDAPCSGTGTLARHPEIRWRLERPQIDELQRLQVRILDKAIAQLARGGRLVYSTCSMETEENEEVVEKILANHRDMSRLPAARAARVLAPHLLPGTAAEAFFDAWGYFRTTPGEFPSDGFFAAILEKSQHTV